MDLLWKIPDCSSLKYAAVLVCSKTDALMRLCVVLAEPVCEPDRWGVSDHREDHQPGCSEDFESAGERLGPYLCHNRQQTTEGQVSGFSFCKS